MAEDVVESSSYLTTIHWVGICSLLGAKAKDIQIIVQLS
jgi:hypothetical protein